LLSVYITNIRHFALRSKHYFSFFTVFVVSFTTGFMSGTVTP
jgi:hypothetical protein